MTVKGAFLPIAEMLRHLPISRAFAEFELDISAARIVTERGAAIDSFYVCEPDGSKVVSAERQLLIEDRLRDAIQQLATDVAE